MADDIAIKLDHVSKVFKLPHEKQTSLKGALISSFRGGKRTFEREKVLNNISFEIKQGEFFGIVGRNGSGKSTLLKMLAGIYKPTKGAIQVNGKLTPFIELGVGFSPELTGRENVFLNGALLGFDRREMNEMYDSIVEFAELERFMDQKLKNYSSGMQVRLAFSIAIRAESQILLLDEVLAVGDAIFQKKCYDYFKTLKKNKRTVVFVSHDTGALQEYCDRGVLIEGGDLVYEGPIDTVVKTYIDVLNNAEENQSTLSGSTEIATKRWGTGEVTVESTKISGAAGASQSIFKENEPIIIDVDFKIKKDVERPVYGITISDAAGEVIFQSNTLWCHYETKDVGVGEVVHLHWEIPNAFTTGTFHVSPAASDSVGATTYDWLDEAATFKVRKEQKSHGQVNIEHVITASYG